ncbi:MAG: terminase large subunit domain-containing protein [Pseudomonadaceae bacterium]
MATWAHHKELADLDKLKDLLDSRGLYVHRPLIIHERNTTGERCQCGCDSPFAIAVETRQHIDLLIEPREGTRLLRQKLPADAQEEFDELALEAKKLYLPRRVSRKQLAAMLCKAKVVAIFGGVRGGKTSYIADHVFDEALIDGGRGTQFWWTAPTLDKTEIGIRKLIEGETIGKGKLRRQVTPLIPPELIRYVPSSAKAERRYIELIDGTRIHLKYAGKDGGNLKGDPPQGAVLDEGCEVDKVENYGELIRRLMEADGRLLIATTPVAGHFLKTEVYDKGVSIEQWEPGMHVAWTHITCFDNPWVSEKMIKETIDTMTDPQEVRREIYGEWVGKGARLWRHFDEDHIIHDLSVSEPKDLGLEDMTKEATRAFYGGVGNDRHCGQDFNLYPMGLVETRVAYHPDDPRKQPILIVTDEIVRKVGTIYEFCDILEKRGMTGVGISCDATGAQKNSYRLSHGIKDKNSTQAREMKRQGFICKPCRTSNGKPSNPAVLDRLNVLHKLMVSRIRLPGGETYPRFLISAKAKKTLISLRVQESDDRGNPIKEAGTETDRLSSPTDALGYAAWPVFRREYEKGATLDM